MRSFVISRVTLLTALTMISTLLAARAHAAILYIDFNNNPQERAAITKASQQFHGDEQLLLVPTENQADGIRLHQLTDIRDRTWESYTAKNCNANLACEEVPTGECRDIYVKLKSDEKAANDAPKTLLTESVIREALQSLSRTIKPNETITLFFSGHFGGGVFTGNLGSFAVTDIKKIFADFPDLQQRVVRLNLLGCYTNTFSQVKSLWRDAFPNARVLAGFHSQSPKGETQPNLQFITTLLRDGKKFDQVKTRPQFEHAVAMLKPFGRINVALAVDDFYQKTNESQPLHLSAADQKTVACHSALPATDLSFYQSVYSGATPIPTSTSDSRLRAYYTSLRNHSSCLAQADFLSQEPETPNPDQVIRLILYRTVVANFRALNGADLANFDSALKLLAIEPEYYSQSIDLSDRKALITWTKQLQERLGQVTDHDAANRILDLLSGLQGTLIDLADRCVPFSWVEPGASEPSQCFRLAGQCGG